MELSNQRTIYIENLPEKIREQDLAEIYRKYGKILRIGLPKIETKNEEVINKGFAFIEFESSEEAQKSIESTNNQIPALIMESDCGEKLGLRVILKENWQQKKTEFKQISH